MITFSIVVQVVPIEGGGFKLHSAHATETKDLAPGKVGVRFLHKLGDVAPILSACATMITTRDHKGVIIPGR